MEDCDFLTPRLLDGKIPAGSLPKADRTMKVFCPPSLVLLYLVFGAINSIGQGIRVESAYYGSPDGVGVDVTGRVQRFADYGEPFRVSNDTLRIDPSPNRPKTLRVVYYVNGQRISETVPEGEVFYFRNGGSANRGPDDYRPGIRIIRALYGARGRYADVTSIVRDRVRQQRPFTATNETFGVDPYPGKGKRLKIYYIRGGEQREKEYAEGDSVRIW
jgi:hypothetical protein